MEQQMMKAARLHAPGDLRIDSVPVPKAEAGEVLVRISACGICGSDVPRVLSTGTYHFPTVPGHEMSGKIVTCGEGVDEMLQGKHVAIIPLIPCRHCPKCEIGEFAQCESYDFLGSRSDGGFAEYVTAPADNCVVIPSDVDLESAAMLEPIATTLHAVESVGVTWGDTAVVFGLGAIGNFTAQWAKVFGADRVFCFDPMTERVEIARRSGLSDAMTFDAEKNKRTVTEESEGFGADVGFEASGSEAAINLGLNILRTYARFGMLGRPHNAVSLDVEAYEKLLRNQLILTGSWSFQFNQFPHHAWRRSADALARGLISTKPLITHRLPLDDLLSGVELMSSGDPSVGKIIITP